MIRSFSDELCHQIITNYQNHAPDFVAPADVEIDFYSSWICFRFYVMHQRLEDHLVVRSVDGEITCNLCIGAYLSAVTCGVDQYGMRWIVPPGEELTKATQSRAEQGLRIIYALTQAFKEELKFLLNSRNLLELGDKKLAEP